MMGVVIDLFTIVMKKPSAGWSEVMARYLAVVNPAIIYDLAVDSKLAVPMRHPGVPFL